MNMFVVARRFGGRTYYLEYGPDHDPFVDWTANIGQATAFTYEQALRECRDYDGRYVEVRP